MGDNPGCDADVIVRHALCAVRTGADSVTLAALAAAGIPQTDPSTGLPLLRTDDLSLRIVGGQCLARWLVDRRGDLVGSATIWLELAELLLAQTDRGAEWSLTLETVLTSYCAVAVDAGQNRTVLERAEEWEALLARHGRLNGTRDVRLKYAEALLNDGFSESARDILASESLEALPNHLTPIYLRLQNKVEAILRRPDEVVGAVNAEEIVAATLRWLAGNAPKSAPTRALRMPLSQLDPSSLAMPAFPAVPSGLKAMREAADMLERSRSPLFALNTLLDACGQVIGAVDQEPAVWGALHGIAQTIAVAADRFGYWEQGTDARWIEVVALRRLKLLPLALERLRLLGGRIDDRRRRIHDPRLRAGVAVYLRHLPWVTVETAYDVDDAPALLQAIEMAKARILGELRPTQTVVDATLEPKVFMDALKKALAADHARRHLLAFLADTTAELPIGDVGILGLLLTADGDWHAAKIPLTPMQVAGAMVVIEQRVSGAGALRAIAKIDPAHPEERPFDDAIAVLAPLVSWLEPFVMAGKLLPGDTLLVSPDGPIHNVPFAMLPLAGRLLIEHFAVASVPSAVLLLDRCAAPPPRRAIALLVPTAAETQRGQNYECETASLERFLTTEQLAGRAVSANDILRVLGGDGGVLHVAAHGKVSKSAPLRARGISLSGEDGGYWLTADDVLRMPLAGAHVSLRACVSGVVTQITSREALGLVWAFLAAGSASLLAASWSVDIDSAQRFFALFYDEWLGRGRSRAAAHRAACCALRQAGGAMAHPYHWAPFTLTIGTLEGDIA